MIIWIIGLAGSGKTTLGKALYSKLKTNSKKVYFIDGDSMRRAFNYDLGYSNKDRRINANRIISFCKMLDQQNITAVVSILHNFPDQRLKNRLIFSKYFEVFLDTPKKIIFKRDQKKIYSEFKKKKIKNVVGLDIKFKKPTTPDIILNGSDPTKINVRRIQNLIENKYIYDKSDYRINKELYFYSDSKEKEFLKIFFKSRDLIVKKLKKIKMNNYYKKSNILKYFLKNSKHKKNYKDAITNLCISYERNRRIYNSFYRNWKVLEKKEIDLDNYIIISYHISRFLVKNFSLQIFNAFLKINDFICFSVLNKKKSLNKKLVLNILKTEKKLIKGMNE